MQTTSFESVISLIDRFPLTTSFVDWLSEGDYAFAVLEETCTETRYARTIRFSAKGVLIQIAKLDLSIDAIGRDFIESFLKAQCPFGQYVAQHPEACITKKWISQTVENGQYVISSEICREGNTCGSCWEAYELDNVQQLLEERGSQP